MCWKRQKKRISPALLAAGAVFLPAMGYNVVMGATIYVDAGGGFCRYP